MTRRTVPALVLLVLCVLAPVRAASAQVWAWPLEGPHAVSRPFAPGPQPWSPGHRGADLPGVPGEQVRSAGDGRVSYAGLLAGRGVVVVTHGALRTTYEPVAAVVGVGQLVAAGEPVGALQAGHLGCPAPACLHWGLLRGEEYLDPVRLVDRGPVRLLPRDGHGADAAVPAPGPLLEPAADAAAGSSQGNDAGRAVTASPPVRDGPPARGPTTPRPPDLARADGPDRRPVDAAAIGVTAAGLAVVGWRAGSLRRRRHRC